jgi:hypothetical protein
MKEVGIISKIKEGEQGDIDTDEKFEELKR